MVCSNGATESTAANNALSAICAREIASLTDVNTTPGQFV